MTSNHTAAWPANTVARYLTIGGATVDITERAGYMTSTDPTETFAICTGCAATEKVEWTQRVWDYTNDRMVDEHDEGGHRSTQKMRKWAQAHAEKCRAMPRPNGGA
ncbi:hypothetical protein [Nonomuraea rubra]|uniref:Uncharacterized protein n=1 Tax=Nonomuraea rubra TaxID=46180 RepID=A0A7X0P6A9_9ACTN|nr:hypothetical protein [Nonomuraea rubra]MBB6556098.1 hypothetical protein [Nonomuraea rubra]